MISERSFPRYFFFLAPFSPNEGINQRAATSADPLFSFKSAGISISVITVIVQGIIVHVSLNFTCLTCHFPAVMCESKNSALYAERGYLPAFSYE